MRSFASTPTPVVVRKTADETVNNSTTQQADNHLLASVAAGAVYLVDGLLIYSATTTADVAIGWTAPGSSTFDWCPNCPGTNATGTTTTVSRAPLTIAQVGGMGGIGAGTKIVAMPAGVFTAGGNGTLTMTWAQNTADASDAIIYANSWLRLTRIA